MSEVLASEICSVRDLLSKPNLTIPTYQRPYKWTSKHINQLFHDIEVHKDKSAYRLGTLVFHQDSQEDNIFNIVDGQQRTLTLFLAVQAILEKCLGRVDATRLKTQLSDLQTHVDSFIKTQTFSSDISKNNLHENYQELKRLVSRSEFGESHINFLLNHCEVVTFTLQNVSEAFQFFDSQNARGRDLEPHDLLKAFHLREFSETESELKANTVAHWEGLDSEKLAGLFAKYLFRVRQWARGHSARYFTKNEVHLFKGVNLDRVGMFPYVEQLRMTHHFVDAYNAQYERKIDGQRMAFPFHLDQMIINGRRFFEMAAHYQIQIDEIVATERQSSVTIDGVALSPCASEIMQVLNSDDEYKARHRTGDRYVRSIFDCLLIYYLDKFGTADISRAIEKIFIWAFRLRIQRQVVQLASVDNHVLEHNLFRVIKEATQPSDFLTVPLMTLKASDNKNNSRSSSADTDPLVKLFKAMNYYE